VFCIIIGLYIIYLMLLFLAIFPSSRTRDQQQQTSTFPFLLSLISFIGIHFCYLGRLKKKNTREMYGLSILFISFAIPLAL